MAVLPQKSNFKRMSRGKRKPLPVVIIKPTDKAIWTKSQPAPRYSIDYKNTKLLIQYISPQGKILPRRSTGLTAKQQRAMAVAIKRARMGGLLPFVNLELPKTRI